MGVTLDLAGFVSELDETRIPEDVLHQAKRGLIDWVGVALAGSADPSVDIVCGVSQKLDPAPRATVIGRGRQTGLLGAALTNGYMSHVLDYDDTYNPARTTVHGSAPVWPVILALSEVQPVSGIRALVAFVAGFETEVRVARAAGPAHYEAGWHVTGTVGHFGAAAAAAAIYALDRRGVAHAFGAAGTQAAGLKGVYGSMGKALHPGKAAMDGLLAAMLARAGFDATDSILEHERGFLAVLSPAPDPKVAVEDLGELWTLRDNGFKPYACGSLTHPTIEAVLDLRHDHDLSPGEIDSIEASVNSYVSWVTAKEEPRTGLEGKFSIYHSAAVAAVDGRASLAQFEDTRVNDPDVVEMRKRVSITVDDDLPKDGAAVAITLTDGRRLTREIVHNKGTPDKPMTDDEVEAKFLDLASPHLGSERANDVAARCWKVESSDDFGEIARLCAGPGR